MRETVNIGLTATALLLVVACNNTPTKAEIEKMVDDRLAERGLLPAAGVAVAAASASATPKASSPGSAAGAVEESLAFLARLDELMRDYHPAAAVSDDDPFRCVTSATLSSNKDLAAARATRKTQADAAKRERERREQELAQLAFRIDYDWKTRKTPDRGPVYGCLLDDGGDYHRDDREDCEKYGHPAKWRVKIPARPGVFVYTGSDTPPADPPELMRRIAAAKIAIPARFSCRVADAAVDKGQLRIQCSGGPQPVLRVSGTALPAVNSGDEVSVPLADTHRDPDGVLARPIDRGPRWTLDADGATLKVDSAANCPSNEQILASVKSKKP